MSQAAGAATTATGPTSTVGDGWRAVLDRLEHDIVATERSLLDGSEPRLEAWEQPQVPGPIPADLRTRAADLLARQHAAVDQVEARLADNREQQAFADVVGRATAVHHRPAYLDLAL